MDFSTIPILDHHCHTLMRPDQPLQGDGFRRFFAETSDPAMAAYIPQTLFYMRMLRDLAALLDCEATEAAIWAARAATAPEAYLRKLFEASNFHSLLIDTGFARSNSYTTHELSQLIERPVETIIRLETLMEELILAQSSFQQVEEALRERIRAARQQGIIALKSIAAYRGGLHVELRSFEEASAAFLSLKERTVREGKLRLSNRSVLDYLLRVSLQEAATAELPVQFHVAFGDDDADLRSANPLNMRALLMDATFRKLPFVLLHCYPYLREAGYLASSYANVFVDVSLTIPLTAHGSIAAFVEVLELAPISKLLFATDAHSVPELFFAGALHGRRALARALEHIQNQNYLTSAQAEQAAEAILWRNAAQLYGK